MYTILVAGLIAVAAPSWGQVINEDIKILPSDGASLDAFGLSISIDNGIIAIGTYGDDDNGDFSGSAYVFDASTGSQIAKLLPIDGAADDFFGISIAIDNGLVAVGAVFDDDNGSKSGSAYVFDASTGTQITKLLPDDGAADDFFGFSIAIDNGIVAVSAIGDGDNGFHSGSVYLFNAITGSQIAKLLSEDGEMSDRFGFSIAIDNGIIAIGAIFDDDIGPASGSAYLFDALSGVQIAKILPNDGASNDLFGSSIAINNGIIAIGAYGDDDNGDSSGSAYVFDAYTGVQIAKLFPSDGEADDEFGFSIAINNDIVAVGAYRDNDNGDRSGSLYLFNAFNGTQIAKLLPSDGAKYDSFGIAVTIENGIIAGGAYFDDANGVGSGSAYVFDVNCYADITDSSGSSELDGTVNSFDVQKLIDNWGMSGVGADIAEPINVVDVFDLLDLLAAWGPCIVP